MKRRAWLTALLLSVSIWSAAHEFWLQPAQYFATPGTTITVQTMVGEQFAGERSAGPKSRLVQYAHLSEAGSIDLTPTLKGEDYGTATATATLTTPGTHLLVFSNTPKFMRMEADKFEAYLIEEGLEQVAQVRRQRGDKQKVGYELYSRCAKTLLQAGDVPSPRLPQAAGLPLDIIPLTNPYALKPGQSLGLEIRLNQQPLPGALVRYWTRSEMGKVAEVATRSNKKGQVRFRLKAGQNMVSTVWMVPATDTTNVPEPADWRSHWSSLTFGVKK